MYNYKCLSCSFKTCSKTLKIADIFSFDQLCHPFLGIFFALYGSIAPVKIRWYQMYRKNLVVGTCTIPIVCREIVFLFENFLLSRCGTSTNFFYLHQIDVQNNPIIVAIAASYRLRMSRYLLLSSHNAQDYVLRCEELHCLLHRWKGKKTSDVWISLSAHLFTITNELNKYKWALGMKSRLIRVFDIVIHVWWTMHSFSHSNIILIWMNRAMQLKLIF